MILLLMAWLIPLSAISANNSCDVNNDGEVNIADVNVVINVILSGNSQQQDGDFVDLGLPSGTLWATRNVGASKPEDYGYYFAWGETNTKTYFDGDNYRWGVFHSYPMYDIIYLYKYCTDQSYGVNGFTDGKTELEPEDDAASVNWGALWRTPTYYQFYELVTQCAWTWQTRNGVKGRLATGPNGKTLFLPAAGRKSTSISEMGIACFYWTSSLDSNHTYDAGCYVSSSEYVSSTSNIPGIIRYWGCAVRAVRIYKGSLYADVNYDGEVNIADINAIIDDIFNGDSQQQDGDFVDLGLPSGTLWATRNVGAESPEDYGDYFAWGETAPKDKYDMDTYKWYYASTVFHRYTKYWTGDQYGGYYDGKTELDPEDDAAYVNWGSSWRMPKYDEFNELKTKCTWVWTTRNSINGYLVTGPNGKTIFLPAAGFHSDRSLKLAGTGGRYWSRTLYSPAPNNAYGLYFDSSGVHWGGQRELGFTVRAVRML